MSGWVVKDLPAEDRVWSEAAREAEAAALTNLRASAEKWAAALTTALGVVSLAALLQGPKVFEPLSGSDAKIAKGAFFGAAVVALIAIALATLAAQQSSAKILGRSGQAYKTWAQGQVDRWRTALSASRWLAALAVAGVLVSASFVWFGEPAPKQPAVIDGRGSALCASASTPAPVAGDGYVIRCGR